MACGTTSTRPRREFAAGAQHTLYSGVELADHGLFYPFQWSALDQRVHYMNAFEAPPPVWERLGRHGTRTLAVDPYESRPPADPPPGALVCGWQLHDRVVLQQWSSPAPTHQRLERLFGAPEPVDEVFGQHHVDEMLGLRRRLLGAPGRVADAAALYLGEQPFDLAWLTFCAAHVAGHQFWDLSQLAPDGLDAAATRVLGSTLDDVYTAIDVALQRVLDALPEQADVMLISPVGMDVNTSRADMLPEMLRAILDPQEPDATPAGGSIWRLRAALPTGMRARVARVLPERVALDLTARLELRGLDWSRTRAFAHPAENQGYVRLNLRGRERDGIVAPEDAEALMDEIADGVRTFTDLDGQSGRGIGRARRRAVRFGCARRPAPRPHRAVDGPTVDEPRGRALRTIRHGPPPRCREWSLGQSHRGRRVGARRTRCVAPGHAFASAAARGHRRHRRRARRRRRE